MSSLLRRVVFAAACLLIPATLMAQDDGWRRVRRNGDAHFRIGGSYRLPAGSTLNGPLVLVGGDHRIDGTVTDDVAVFGGIVALGPTAVVEGDLKLVGGNISIDPAAQIRGDFDQVTASWGVVPIRIGGFPDVGQRFWSWLTAWLTIIRLTFVFAAGLLLSLVAPGWLRSISHQASTAGGWSFLAGAATEILITPAVALLAIALVITIVGIPLLAAIPVLVGVLMLLWLAGFTAVAARLGQFVRGGDGERPVVDFAVGFFILTGVTIASQVVAVGPGWLTWLAISAGAIGFTIEYVAWTIGLGAALLVAFNRNRGFVPPPLPPRPPARGDDAPLSAPA